MSVCTDTMRYYSDLDRSDAIDMWREAHVGDAIDNLMNKVETIEAYLEQQGGDAELIRDCVAWKFTDPLAARLATEHLRDAIVAWLGTERTLIARELDAMWRSACDV